MRKNQTRNIIISLIIFFIISIVSIYSASSITSSSFGNIFIKQIIYYVIGVFLLLFSYRYKEIFIKYHYLLYILCNFLLALLLIFGESVNGSRCWLLIGPFSFQPSEFMKISLIFTISIIIYKNKKNDFILLLKVLIILLIPSILTFIEPDTGVVIIYFIIVISLIIYKGLNKKYYLIFLILITFFIGSFTYLYFFNKEILLKLLGNNIYYRLDRILNWSTGSGYQLENSLIAISSSGIIGHGFNNIPIYYPEASTDFIFTSFSTCFGFIGSFILIILIMFFDISIAKLINKKKRIDNYILIGIFSMLLYQQFQNIAMTLGILPITGITLPFISYGGSSLLSYMFIMGIILNIAQKEKYIN